MSRAYMTPKRRHKYGAIPTVVDGIRFDSKAEARRYQELRLLEKAGEIQHLNPHPSYDLWVVGGEKNGCAIEVTVGRYTADFSYVRQDEVVIEDVKSPATRKKSDYRLRKRMVEAIYGITITEVM